MGNNKKFIITDYSTYCILYVHNTVQYTLHTFSIN
jgi:hypothetical protein